MQTNIYVSAGRDSGLGSIKLSVGETSTTVEVAATAPLIETTQSQVTNTFSGTTLSTFAGIQENEGLDRLALFVPGVVARAVTTSRIPMASDSPAMVSAAATMTRKLMARITTTTASADPACSFLTPNLWPIRDHHQQFGPEYGRNAGSVVNIITKSGANTWHGSVFGQNRSSFTEALSNTQHNTNKPGSQTAANPLGTPFTGPPRFNEEFSGGTVGGPIVKNKAFLFGGFDNDLFSGSNVFTTSSLTPTPTGLATLAGCGAAINPTALSILQKFGPYGFGFGSPTPRPNSAGTFATQTMGTCAGVQVGGVTRIVSTPAHGFDFVVRNDLQLGSDTLTSRYLFNRNNSFNINDNGAGGWFRNTPALSQALLESWTHNFGPRMVNEARVSFSRLNVEFGGGTQQL